MKYLSVCSGIEAATVAWHPLGMQPVAFSEIEAFPSAVLAEHYPDVPNLGDMTEYKEWNIGSIDILVGGTPCQSFSVAGLRKGLSDPRGNLMLTYGAIAGDLQPTWIVWENVPGVLSSNKGRDFGAFLGMLGELGYGFAYRILDAQFFKVPQRRRRVFVVGYLGDWRPAAAVLFESESLQGHPAPSREARTRVAASLTRGTDSNGKGGYAGRRQEDDFNIVTQSLTGSLGAGGPDDNKAQGGFYVPSVSPAMKARDAKGPSSDGDGDGLPLLAMPRESSPIPFDTTQITSRENRANPKPGDPMHPLSSGAHAPAIARALRGEGFDASEDGTGRGTPIVPVAYDLRGRDGGAMPEGPHDTANIRASSGGSSRSYVAEMAVRRLTPRECERLQGFPDDYTAITYRGKPAADGPRYRALGNSMAVPVMRWIGRRLIHPVPMALGATDAR